MGPYGPIWVARGEKSNVEKVKIIISDCDFFRGLCLGDAAVVVGAGFAVFLGAAVVVAAGVAAGKAAAVAMGAGASGSCAAIAVGAASRANINNFILQLDAARHLWR